MTDKPQKGKKEAVLATRMKPTAVDTMMHRAGALRMTIIGLFAFIHTFREKYKVILEFAGNNHIDVTDTLLMRVRIIARNGVSFDKGADA